MNTSTQPLAKTQSDLIRLVRTLQDDLRQRCEDLAEVAAPLRTEYAQAAAAQNTQETYKAWSGNYLNQVAVAWVLAGVFVRYLEDNDLIEERWLASVDSRRGEPRERYTAFFRAHPELSDREYFHEVFDQVAELPGCHDLFARDRNPLWKVGISGDGAKILREFFAEVDTNTGELIRTFGGDTRFLGDLYQNLSEEAQKKYALLQTPEFVEEFILDRTLDPALAEFGLENVKLIDPTCGSGHFLLGAFHRLFHRWEDAGYLSQNTSSMNANPRVLARRALEAVHGVDINPFAVAIARFRLVIAFVKACGLSRLREMPDVKVNVATGDSLLHGNTICSAKGWGVQELSDWLPDAFAAGDFEDASQILSQRYEAVVGNPPYITARDKAHNNEVRSRYRTAYMKYSLAVPFKEKFWDLAVEGKGQQRAGFVGMITANSFMKREFGSRVIEEFFPRVDLTHVIDTSGAYIPGHGTPTVILLGRNRAPVSATVRAVLGIRGEPSTPADPAQGLVWRSIVELLECPGESSAFVSVTEFDRATFARHPWSIGGGGASELKERIESVATPLSGQAEEIGWTTVGGEDDVWIHDPPTLAITELLQGTLIPLMIGDRVRDWSSLRLPKVIYPYQHLGGPPVSPESLLVTRYLWPYARLLKARTMFKMTLEQRGLPFYEHMQHSVAKLKTPLSIVFAFVATHNHFVLDRGGKVFKQSAPVIKLKSGATEAEHLALVGVLNSAVGNFWVRQVGFSKGGDYVGTEGARVIKTPWEDRLERDGSKLQNFPVPASHQQTQPLARQLDQLAAKHSALDPATFIPQSSPGQRNLAEKRVLQQHVRQRMIALQEELDWLSYQLYGILDPAPLAADPPLLQLGERAFEIALARSEEETTWFSRHGSTPITELPAHWPPDYRAIVEKRLDLIANNPEIALLEKPEHKRRWQQRPWEERLKEALTTWLQDRIEAAVQKSNHLQTIQQLADQLAHDGEFQQVLQIYLGTNDYDAAENIQKLVQPQAVPYLAALRYSEAGLRIRADWERTWELQRREDAGETVESIPVPPKYGQKDFLKSEYWSLRGKLDVPKERFISYPGAEREADVSMVIGWAGWDHLQRAQTLASYALERREQDGWEDDRLLPLLAGLAELLPWLKQWHNQVDPATGERMADYFEAFLQEQLRELSLTPSQLATWRPAARKARSKARES